MTATTEPSTAVGAGGDEQPGSESTPKPKRLLIAPPEIPERGLYKLKCKLLGKPLNTEALEHERLNKTTALAVFSSDCISSSAYATEEILAVLVKGGLGFLAFSMVLPTTLAMIGVLLFLILSYRQTIKEYPSAGGAYIVTKDNFGVLPAQVAGVALLTDYILTVSVSTAAGTAAIASLIARTPLVASNPWLIEPPMKVAVTLSFIALIAFMNLRGVKESGVAFAVPTYFYIGLLGLTIVAGVYRFVAGSLPVCPQVTEAVVTTAAECAKTLPSVEGIEHFNSDLVSQSGNLVMGFALAYVLMHGFAAGGTAVTGVEAISNGVPAFKKPEWKNARQTLTIMGGILAFLFCGLSFLASRMHIAPHEGGVPTVISEIGKSVYGTGGIGSVLYPMLQIGTALILILAANTSFADFPRLASSVAGDYFMPTQLKKRGHRLVFSNGIIFLSVAAALLVILTGADVSELIPMYAIGVFTSFTLSQSGMAKHHVRKKEKGWRTGVFINGFGAFLSFVVLVMFGVTKFTEGAWRIIILIPILVLLLFRLNRQYESEIAELDTEVEKAVESRILPNHTVLVLVDKLTRSTALGIRYARTLMPNELRCVHVAIDPIAAKDLTEQWRNLATSSVELQVVECPDRRISRSVAEVVADTVADGETEVTVLVPRREYAKFWHRLLHDRTSDEISDVVGMIPHANVTFVPYHFGRDAEIEVASLAKEAPTDEPGRKRKKTADAAPVPQLREDGSTPVASVEVRRRVTVRGRVVAMRVRPWAVSTDLELTIGDDTGRLLAVFNGRKSIAGIELGSELTMTGMVGEYRGRLTIRNPVYQILSTPYVHD